MAVSVVMPVGSWTTDGHAQIIALLEQVEQLSAELVVVDNAVPCARAQIVSAVPDSAATLVICAHEIRSPAHARNVGAASASGDILVFADADDLVGPNWLTELVRVFEDDAVGIAGGRLDEMELNADKRSVTRETLTREGLPYGFYFRPYVPSGNLAVRADMFRAAAGFCPLMIGAEDIDLSWRMLESGTRLAYAADAIVRVRYRERMPDSCRQGFRWGRGGARLVRRWRSERPGAGPRLPSAGYRLGQIRSTMRTAWRARTVAPLARQLCYQTGLIAGAIGRGQRGCEHLVRVRTRNGASA